MKNLKFKCNSIEYYPFYISQVAQNRPQHYPFQLTEFQIALRERSLLTATGGGVVEFSDSGALKSCPPRRRRAENLPPLKIHALKFCPPPNIYIKYMT